MHCLYTILKGIIQWKLKYFDLSSNSVNCSDFGMNNAGVIGTFIVVRYCKVLSCFVIASRWLHG